MEITISWIFGGVVTLVTGVISWSLKELYNNFKASKADTNKKIEELQTDMKEKDNEIKQNVENIRKSIETYKQELPEKYVLKDEFNREINKLDLKLDEFKSETYERLDSVKNEIMGLSNNVAALLASIKN